ncbi:MAG TPA: ribosome small subunit-dependent GTPase A [Propionibacteriaceae bacterium]|nr:ribosome small subunit-dependent GTPase A [Propionibacteriaceae bacterium]
MSRRGTGSVFEDDHAGFDRPARRTRPRTKDRPDYSKLVVGRVVTIDRGRYRCVVDGRTVTAAKARSLGRASVIVGDVVHLDGDTSGEPGTLARIVETVERTTVLRRTADDDDPYERPIVANADQLVIVTSLADPPPRMGMIDRILIAAYDAGIDPVLCLTKSDLDDPSEIVAAYEPLGLPIVVTRIGAELSQLRSYLDDHVSVLVGHSGVGKSTLVNALIPDAHRAIGEVNDVTGRGRHTSTSAIALELPGGSGWVVDTPGVRSFGLSHVDPRNVLRSFSDLDELTDDCPRGCTHAASEPECALDTAVAEGRLAPERLASFRRIQVAERTP